MSKSSIEWKKGSNMDEKMLYDVAAVTPVAEDTVEAAHQCTLTSLRCAFTWIVANIISSCVDTSAEFTRIRNKTDLFLMPMLWILGGLRKLLALKLC